MVDNVCLVCNLFECTEELVHHDRFQIYEVNGFSKDGAYLNGLEGPSESRFLTYFLAASNEPVGVVKT